MKIGIHVLSNASKTHLIFDESDKTACGIDSDCSCSETRFELSYADALEYVRKNRHEQTDKARLCKRCHDKFTLLRLPTNTTI
jgi:uncharacterized protein (DUF927 family)